MQEHEDCEQFDVGIYVNDQGGWLQIGGTSASSPIWAGYLSNINAAFSWSGLGKLGFFNPVLYSVGAYVYGYGEAWYWLYDVVSGSNGSTTWYGYPGYTNGQGYSNTTGNGSPNSYCTVGLLVSGTQPGTPPGSFTTAIPKPKATSCTLEWTPSSGASAYAIEFRGTSEIFLGNAGYYRGHIYLADAKATSYKVTGLTPSSGQVNIHAFNASGSVFSNLNFTTKP
jgi:hypothetical protein